MLLLLLLLLLLNHGFWIAGLLRDREHVASINCRQLMMQLQLQAAAADAAPVGRPAKPGQREERGAANKR